MSTPQDGEPWDFDYAPVPVGGGDDGAPERDLVVATTDDVDPAVIAELLAGGQRNLEVTPIFNGHPIFWTRVQSSEPIDRDDLATRLTAAGIKVRYVTSARRGNQRLPPPLDMTAARVRRGSNWLTRNSTTGPEPESAWRWFLGAGGVNVLRPVCGTGAGTRLAVIDNDGRDLERSALDAEVMIGVRTIPRAGAHASLLVGWAVGSRTNDGRQFRGVAPDSSPRLYCIPKSGDEIVSLPLAIVRAVEDGADVIVCATYVEGHTSMLLDDALEFATRLGRMGRGTVVVMPTGREMSSPPHSILSSMSLAMADPASDPRVSCVGPSARDGGWFLWRDRLGKLRPFANRGPSVRWLAPGDDMASPLAESDRPAHAESSGASAVAAGVLLLLLEQNPDLNLTEVDRLLIDTATPIDPAQRSTEQDLGNPSDLLPVGRDPDGHNAKHGYGRLCASAACLSARDPIAATLVAIGEHRAAVHYVLELRRTSAPYGDKLARWAARTLLRDALLTQAFRSVARAVRLATRHPDRARQQHPGHLVRQFGIVVRLLLRVGPPNDLNDELIQLDKRIRDALRDAQSAAAADHAVLGLLTRIEGWSGAREGASPRHHDDRLRMLDRVHFTDEAISKRESASH